MTPDEAVMAVIDALERGCVPYMIVGSLASNFHGIPRATADADFVVEIGPAPSNGSRKTRVRMPGIFAVLKKMTMRPPTK